MQLRRGRLFSNCFKSRCREAGGMETYFICDSDPATWERLGDRYAELVSFISRAGRSWSPKANLVAGVWSISIPTGDDGSAGRGCVGGKEVTASRHGDRAWGSSVLTWCCCPCSEARSRRVNGSFLRCTARQSAAISSATHFSLYVN